MTWVAWRQHRLQLLLGAAAVTALALFLIPTGLDMSHFFTSSGLARCLRAGGAVGGADCGQLDEAFGSRYGGYAFLVPLFLVAPVLFGIFFGAPLIAREIDSGTYRLAWTQGVTRPRWLTRKLAMVVGAAAAGSVSLAYLVTWWSRPLVANSGKRFQFGIFDLRGVVPIGYAIFAVMLGIAIGAVIKKTLPAIGLTLVGFAAVRVGIEFFVRQHYLAAKTTTQSFFADGPLSGRQSWVISQNTIDRLGHVISRGGGLNFEYLAARCPAVAAGGPFQAKGAPGGVDVMAACVQHLGIRTSVIYQPGSRFWTFQWIEFGIFIALAIGLGAFTLWRTKRLS
jgi:hypothetical protein